VWGSSKICSFKLLLGGDQPIKTTRAILQQWSATIPYTNLPKTIQDVIITTSELGLHYLWIDYFCIIQDDPDDMAEQIAQMPHIYSQAAITIAPSRPSTVFEGFLHAREMTSHPDLLFELPFRCPNGDLGTVTLLQLPTGAGIEPLDKRAWPLQE
jgi:hypothetical protein